MSSKSGLRGISWLVVGVKWETRDAARQLGSLDFVLFYLDVIGVGNYLTHPLFNNTLCAQQNVQSRSWGRARRLWW